MFWEFYGFQKEPFSITPDPDFLYLSDSHREALAQLIYGVDTKKGFIVVTGKIGVGKTTILNAFLRQLVKTEVIPAFIFNTKLTPIDFFKLIADELGLHEPHSKAEFVLTLNDFLILCHSKGEGPVVLIIDEAHNLSDELLEEIRLLLNLETNTEKLVQIVLAGQPELWEKLKQPKLQQLRERIFLSNIIEPLDSNDTVEYIRMRIKLSRGRFKNIFSKKALKKIYKYSRGVPRLINLICTHAFISGYASGKKSIDSDIIKEVAKDLNLVRPRLFGW